MESQSLTLAYLQQALAASTPEQRLDQVTSLSTQIGDACRTDAGRAAMSAGNIGASIIETLVELLSPNHPVLLGGGLEDPEEPPGKLLEPLCATHAAILRALGNLGIENDHSAENIFAAGVVRATKDCWEFWWPGHAEQIEGTEAFTQLKRNLCGSFGNFVVNNGLLTRFLGFFPCRKRECRF